MRSIAVEIKYIGSCLSVNHYKYRGRFTKEETKDWMDALGWLIKPARIEEWKLPLTVRCDGAFKDLRSTPDLSNLSKVILDAIEKVTRVNDRDMRWQDGDITYIGKWALEPMLEITITEGNNES